MASSLAGMLEDLQVSNGLEMAAVVTADGLVIDSAASADIDVEAIGSVASNGLLIMDALGQELGEQEPDMMTLEYGGHIVLMSPLAAEYLLVLITGGGANLGRIRIVVRRRKEALVGALENA